MFCLDDVVAWESKYFSTEMVEREKTFGFLFFRTVPLNEHPSNARYFT